MGGALILLGAGASIDAGLPSAFSLTEMVYERLRQRFFGNRDGRQAILFGYVVSKLRARRALQGISPFLPINIEDAYEAVLRIVGRDSDFLSDFVYSWDPILEHLKPRFDESAFVDGLVRGFADQRRSLERGIVSANTSELSKSARAISRVVNGDYRPTDAKSVASLYLYILVDLLSKPSGSTDYLDALASSAADLGATVATLNYDLLFESAAQRRGITIDYGLSEWNERRVVRWQKNCLRLLKLHGSANWIGKHDEIIVDQKNGSFGTMSYKDPLLIFGGQNRKLTPDGPFLQLRSELEKAIMAADKILIIGYSLGDEHLNAIIRDWAATRRRGRLIFIDPGKLDLHRISGKYGVFTSGEKGESEAPVEIKVIASGAESGLRQALDLLKARFARRH